MSADILAAPGSVTVVKDNVLCGCGQENTTVRVYGQPFRWICWLKAGQPGIPGHELPPSQITPRLRLLEDLTTAAYAPRVQYRGKMTDPFWRPPLADVDDLVHHAAFTWARPFEGPVTILDRSGAHISAAASVQVAHGPLTGRGRIPWAGAPGYYKVAYADWHEEGTPHPLGGGAKYAQKHGEVWVPHTRVKLLADLARDGRWPELGDMDAWTGDKAVRLDRWAKHVNTLRGAAIDRFGRDSDEYRAVKENFSQAIALMIGTKEAGQKRTWKGRVWRSDWAYAVKDLSACTMWRWCDDLQKVAAHAGRPGSAPTAIGHADELYVPSDALELFTTTERLGGRKPLVLDKSGKQLGTFKVKYPA